MTIMTDAQGKSRKGEGTTDGGEWVTPPLSENDPLAPRAAPAHLLPSREIASQINRLSDQTVTIQVREDLQATLRNLREINNEVADIELSDDGYGVIGIYGAWDAAGNDIANGDWLQNGRIANISELDEDGDRFPITRRYFDYEGSPLSALAKPNDEHLAWDVNVDAALSVNATDPTAVTASEKAFAISWGSRGLAAALEKQHISEGHQFISEIKKPTDGLPDEVVSIQIIEIMDDDDNGDACSLEVHALDSKGMYFVDTENETLADYITYAKSIKCSLYDLQAHGDYDPIAGDGEAPSLIIDLRSEPKL